MLRKKIFIIVLIVFLGVTFVFDSGVALGMTRKTKGKTKATVKKKNVHRKTKSMITTKQTSKNKWKKKTRKHTNKGRVHSRGSGDTLGDGIAMNVVNYAKKYLGVTYSFGSSSASSFDCSGFIMFIYKTAGINLPHSASGQANLGLAVSKGDLKPGDLVFFETYKPGISHVGMYVGNGQFIHASSGAGHVTITSLSDSYYVERFRGATRVLNN